MSDYSREQELSSINWELPDSILIEIFSNLDVRDLLNVGIVCQSWYRVSNDEFLWKDLFLRDWNIEWSIQLAPKKTSWKAEYIRLAYHVPSEESEMLTEHENQVLHVAFAHNGESFSTCSKDCHILVWNVGHPTKLKYKENMSEYGWSYTQFSEYNSTDTLLLVSGVFHGRHATSGEIIIFNIPDGFTLQCRVSNKPYDMFGTWYNENYLLAGNLHILQHLVSCSSVLLNKAWQESDSEKKPVLKRLFKFENKCASSIRCIQVSKCFLPHKEEPMPNQSSNNAFNATVSKGNPFSQQTAPISSTSAEHIPPNLLEDPSLVADNNIHYNQDYREQELRVPVEESDDSLSSAGDYSDSDDQDHSVTYYIPSDKKRKQEDTSWHEHNRVLDPETKLLIFTMGSKTYTPHQVGFKIIKPFKFPETVRETLTLAKQLREKAARQNEHDPDDAQDFIESFFDPIDHIIDFNGHIIGMALSPDQRHLYVNCRPWPEYAIISDPLCPPPIAEQIDIHVIDMTTLKKVGKMLRSHKAFTPNNDCFFIFLSVSDQYVGSGAEDRHGYLWERHYGIMLKNFKHNDVVNSVAFNPKDPEMFITVSDDCTIKVWRSKQQMHRLHSGKLLDET